ncbi:hypothetical protein ACTHUE_20210, partial [Neisseria sp. P0021.S005]
TSQRNAQHYITLQKIRPSETQLGVSDGLSIGYRIRLPLQHNTAANAEIADEETVKIMNPLNYIGKPGVNLPQNWRIRVGTNDRDTSLAVSAILTAKLQNNGQTVDYALPWDVGHSGDYDLDELFAWMKQVSNSAK